MTISKLPGRMLGALRSAWSRFISLFRPKQKGNPDSDMYPLW
ncbi:MAG TPA: hypothetical protein VFE47_22460 [Tepidisphaeraceae bacterium]|nr:hypothetical protein [Tepidisphaeraceae bacterium]